MKRRKLLFFPYRNYEVLYHEEKQENHSSRVRIKFQDTECDHDYRYGFTFPVYVELEKDREQRRLKLIEPGMVALLTMYISRRELFKTRKEITLHGQELLADMGYDIVRIENDFEF